VKSQSARGLDKLRAILEDDGTQTGLPEKRDSRNG
jgi:hypothetical protein